MNNNNRNSKTKDLVILIVRLFVGFAMLANGFPKLQFLLSGGKSDFFNFVGLGPNISLGLTVFAECFCSVALILGTFTRISLSFLGFTMLVAAFMVHGSDPFEKKELALLYLAVYLLLLVTGPGKFSVDNVKIKKENSSESYSI